MQCKCARFLLSVSVQFNLGIEWTFCWQLDLTLSNFRSCTVVALPLQGCCVIYHLTPSESAMVEMLWSSPCIVLWCCTWGYGCMHVYLFLDLWLVGTGRFQMVPCNRLWTARCIRTGRSQTIQLLVSVGFSERYVRSGIPTAFLLDLLWQLECIW